MSDDLDLDMEVVKGDELDDLAGGESSPEMEEPERTELSKNPGPEEGEGASMLTAGANGNREWRRKPLEVVSDIIMGSSPKSEYYNESEEGPPFLQANNEFGYRSPTADRWCSNPAKRCKKGDLLMTIRGTYVGQMNLADDDYCIGRGLAAIAPGDDLNGEYLFHYLDYIESYVKSIAAGSTFDSVSSDDIESLEVKIPPLPEQRKIASVLYAVDQAIQKTEEIIEQAERVRKGLEQKLLTRGIFEDGGHRRDSELEYKSSWVGKVPTEWRTCEYGDLLEDSSVGIVVKPSQYYDSAGTVPILRSKDISRDGIVDGEFEYMTKSSNEKNSNSELNEGDVITVRSGDPGLSCVVPSEYDGSNCADLLISTPGPELSPEYAAMWINSYAGRRQIDRFQAGLAQKHFNLGALRKLRIAVPPIEEQERIIQVEKQITDFIGVGRKNRDRLKRLKRGLMQDLLTGEVRTMDKAIEVLGEVKAHG